MAALVAARQSEVILLSPEELFIVLLVAEMVIPVLFGIALIVIFWKFLKRR
nr:hypothetical protein EFPHDIBJ_EFPHDIBJ_CDS_0003 [Microvirus sp.]